MVGCFCFAVPAPRGEGDPPCSRCSARAAGMSRGEGSAAGHGARPAEGSGIGLPGGWAAGLEQAEGV